MRKIFQSFAARLTFYVLTLTFLIFCGIAVVFISYGRERERRQAGQYTALMQQNVIQRIDAELADVETAIRVAEAQVDDMAYAPDSVMKIACGILQSNRLLKGVGIAFRPGYYSSKGSLFMEYVYKRANGRLLYQHYGDGIDDYTRRSWWGYVMRTKKPYWTEPYRDNGNKSDFMVSYMYPCLTKRGDVYAVIVADMTLDDITANLKTMRPYRNSYSFILSNKTGKYVSHPDRELILATNYRVRSKLIDCPALNPVGDSMVRGERGAMRTEIEGRDVLLCYAPIRRTGWSVCSVNMYADVMRNLGSTTFYTLLILLAGLLMLSVCIRQLVKFVSKPMRQLTEAAYQIARGNFSAELPVVDTKDDLRQLHDSFANMQRSLKLYVEELEHTTRAKERIESELSIAHSIQMSLVPKIFSPFPDCRQLDLYAYLDPAKEVGGDFYDFFLSRGQLFFVIGDVSGKGIPASLVMAITRTLFRIITASTQLPAEIVAKLNSAIAKDNDANMFVTMFAGVLDYTTGQMAYCNAGHNPPLLCRGGKVEFLPAEHNLPIGVLEDVEYKEQTIRLAEDDGLLLYTDGLTEAENAAKEQFGEERMQTVMEGCGGLMAKDIVEKIKGALDAFVDGAEQSDDLTLLFFRLMDTEQKQENMNKRTLKMENRVEESSRLYPFVQEIGEALHADSSQLSAINLAVEEAVVNSIMYAYPEGEHGYVELAAQWDAAGHELAFVLQDQGVAFDPLAQPEADTTLPLEERQPGGLGILLVREIMDDVSYQRSDGKNILTMKKRL